MAAPASTTHGGNAESSKNAGQPVIKVSTEPITGNAAAVTPASMTIQIPICCVALNASMLSDAMTSMIPAEYGTTSARFASAKPAVKKVIFLGSPEKQSPICFDHPNVRTHRTHLFNTLSTILETPPDCSRLFVPRNAVCRHV